MILVKKSFILIILLLYLDKNQIFIYTLGRFPFSLLFMRNPFRTFQYLKATLLHIFAGNYFPYDIFHKLVKGFQKTPSSYSKSPFTTSIRCCENTIFCLEFFERNLIGIYKENRWITLWSDVTMFFSFFLENLGTPPSLKSCFFG